MHGLDQFQTSVIRLVGDVIPPKAKISQGLVAKEGMTSLMSIPGPGLVDQPLDALPVVARLRNLVGVTENVGHLKFWTPHVDGLVVSDSQVKAVSHFFKADLVEFHK